MAEKVHHLEGPWGWGEVGTVELVALACTAPHDCNARGCPGPVNKRKLEAFDELLAALTKIATAPEGAYSRDKEQYLKNVIEWCQETAQAAIAKAQEVAP